MFSCKDKTVKLIDLGGAVPIQNPNFETYTIGYYAPEVLGQNEISNLNELDKEGKLKPGKQTDVFSIGQMAYENYEKKILLFGEKN